LNINLIFIIIVSAMFNDSTRNEIKIKHTLERRTFLTSLRCETFISNVIKTILKLWNSLHTVYLDIFFIFLSFTHNQTLEKKLRLFAALEWCHLLTIEYQLKFIIILKTSDHNSYIFFGEKKRILSWRISVNNEILKFFLLPCLIDGRAHWWTLNTCSTNYLSCHMFNHLSDIENWVFCWIKVKLKKSLWTSFICHTMNFLLLFTLKFFQTNLHGEYFSTIFKKKNMSREFVI
jgi:hypothetical protein